MSPLILLIALASFVNYSFAITESTYQAKVANIYDSFKQGDYPSALTALDLLEKQLDAEKGDITRKGFVYYFKGVVLAKTYEFNESIENFKKAIKLNYDAEDLYYEYAQVLYTDERLEPARLAFKESIKKGFKRGVSLYYIAYISSLMGEDKRAVKFFNAINRLPEEEKNEILQSAEAQVGEIYLKRVLKKNDAVRKIKEYVIPQFEKALAVDTDSEQGRQIRQRIFDLQKRYELILLKMRNGRPVYYPRHFLRFLQTVGTDSNVAYQTDDAISANTEEASSLFSESNFFGRYSFTLSNVMFVAPEIGLRYKKHFSDEDSIKAFDTYGFSAALRTSLEYYAFGKPASLLFDYSIGQDSRFDATEEGFKFFSRTHNFSLGQKFDYFNRGTSILRFNFSTTDRAVEADQSNGSGLSLEQVIKLSDYYSAFLYTSYTKNTSDNPNYENTQFLAKIDFILPAFWINYQPFIGFLGVMTTPEFNKEERGTENTFGPNFRISKRVGTNSRLNLRYDYQINTSGSEDYEFKKSILAVDFEAVF